MPNQQPPADWSQLDTTRLDEEIDRRGLVQHATKEGKIRSLEQHDAHLHHTYATGHAPVAVGRFIMGPLGSTLFAILTVTLFTYAVSSAGGYLWCVIAKAGAVSYKASVRFAQYRTYVQTSVVCLYTIGYPAIKFWCWAFPSAVLPHKLEAVFEGARPVLNGAYTVIKGTYHRLLNLNVTPWVVLPRDAATNVPSEPYVESRGSRLVPDLAAQEYAQAVPSGLELQMSFSVQAEVTITSPAATSPAATSPAVTSSQVCPALGPERTCSTPNSARPQQPQAPQADQRSSVEGQHEQIPRSVSQADEQSGHTSQAEVPPEQALAVEKPPVQASDIEEESYWIDSPAMRGRISRSIKSILADLKKRRKLNPAAQRPDCQSAMIMKGSNVVPENTEAVIGYNGRKAFSSQTRELEHKWGQKYTELWDAFSALLSEITARKAWPSKIQVQATLDCENLLVRLAKDEADLASEYASLDEEARYWAPPPLEQLPRVLLEKGSRIYHDDAFDAYSAAASVSKRPAQDLGFLQRQYKQLHHLHTRIAEKLFILIPSFWVTVRVRGSLPTETDRDYITTESPSKGKLSIHTTRKNHQGETVQDSYMYSVDVVFQQSASNQTVSESLLEKIQAFQRGKSVCIFADGQTGSGPNSVASFVAQQLVGLLEARSGGDDYERHVECSFVEVYKNDIYDLHTGTKAKASHVVAADRRPILAGHPWITFKVFAVTSEVHRQALSPDKLLNVITKACKRRNVRGVKDSSRSHEICILTLHQVCRYSKELTKSTLLLVDLAGSERQPEQEEWEGQSAEATEINKSRTTLFKILVNLGTQADNLHPWRESKVRKSLSFKSIACTNGHWH
ncbi:hypothetical protein W97_09062 [Coniosporium apollinis CBS 100218]|uniref:Kinesin-like protein n=1 Tax=Coniosporium apollinis (strain CBS 100218) TaxID=1168221 RepID=R7Z709_CONA1|nr:uncharacterized protein W97_09062 [Coniosporium apollinis CBS 100218]EON69799.1 hypothetical protein W97_09062 [Coniosporium apollinis CBS 100218]